MDWCFNVFHENKMHMVWAEYKPSLLKENSFDVEVSWCRSQVEKKIRIFFDHPRNGLL